MLRWEEPGKDRTDKSHASGKSHTVYLRYTTLYNISKFRHASGQERKKKTHQHDSYRKTGVGIPCRPLVVGVARSLVKLNLLPPGAPVCLPWPSVSPREGAAVTLVGPSWVTEPLGCVVH